ncbi:phage tail assembly chaperone [Bacillus subtilis]|uniref:phage tail assembly chaperone n=1 Tax=Pseudomonas sp. MWU12-2029 TaxID=2927805 RepID=UPI00200BE3D7|nr:MULTISPECIES: phage tail assembly chaperone [unclassified Pseudomonas]MDL5600607.1 phage tail assembly chaperone [Bacillus subtilis]
MTDVIFFSPSTCGAYLPSIHQTGIPEDVVPIPLRDWELLLDELAKTPKKIGAGVDGKPMLVDPPPLDTEFLKSLELGWRNAELSSTDGLVSRHRDELESSAVTTFTVTQYAELQAYRQALRHWPQVRNFPLVEHRPQMPSWLIESKQ